MCTNKVVQGLKSAYFEGIDILGNMHNCVHTEVDLERGCRLNARLTPGCLASEVVLREIHPVTFRGHKDQGVNGPSSPGRDLNSAR